MQRHGAVLNFKPGVTRQEAEAAVAKLADVIELPTFTYRPTGKRTVGLATLTDRKEQVTELVQDYDDNIGGPVWYIP